jgi:DNA adenine methylase
MSRRVVTAQLTFDFNGAVPTLNAPLIKYAGAKNWLVKLLAIRLHAHLAGVADSVYVEPFAGSLALGLAVGWPGSIYSDTSADLMNLYFALADDGPQVADEVDTLRALDGEESYYKTRESVWPENRATITRPSWAARTIWLNRNCFNGLTRTNQKGQFNVPWGKRHDIALPSRDHLERVGRLLKRATLCQDDFAIVLDAVHKAQDPRKLVVYLDPPYGAKLKNVSTRGARDRGGASGDGVFTGYAGTFTWADQVRLAEWARALARLGSLVVASNAWSDEICDLYRDDFALFQVGVQHSVGATGARRGRRAEMLAVSTNHASVLDSVPAKITRKK